MSENILIELKGLTKRYGYGDTETFALKDFDLTIKRGEFIMIMGPSGCGKTTLLDIIGLLDRATRGEYILNGENVAGISARRQAKLRAKKIGFVFQNFNLIEDLPIIENVALPLVYTGYTKTSRLKQASSALKRFHLQEREYYYPYQLSGGQQQRVAIARAIVGSPEIILADEPTGNLDSRSSHIVMEELKAIHEEGNTIIMVTHNPSLTVYATRVINMLDGQIDTDVKTVADANLPQPISVKIKRRKERKAAIAASIELPTSDSVKESKESQESTSEPIKNSDQSDQTKDTKHSKKKSKHRRKK
ncbi:ABC transporter ATP-binding protein [Candidatus Saccharibacteria bacterium]|nr:ABC transporter ATP-binding protein [Candidatus Saccharibacteria bacterium]